MDSVLSDNWFAMTLVQQMINIGNEVKRAVRFDANMGKKTMFLDRAIWYTELTMKDPKKSEGIAGTEYQQNGSGGLQGRTCSRLH